jgi:hypothetical protein
MIGRQQTRRGAIRIQPLRPVEAGSFHPTQHDPQLVVQIWSNFPSTGKPPGCAFSSGDLISRRFTLATFEGESEDTPFQAAA